MRLRKVANKKGNIGIVTSNIVEMKKLLDEIYENADSVLLHMDEESEHQYSANLHSILESLSEIKKMSDKVEEAYEEKKMEYDK